MLMVRHLVQTEQTRMCTRKNLITDVNGLIVGNSEDPNIFSGVTVIIGEAPLAAAVDVRGGAPGTRETDALGLAGTVEEVHAIVLSGGSAFGLDAAGAVQGWLAARGVGFAVGTARVPIIPQAVLFDLLNGGRKDWARDRADASPYRRLAIAACEAAARDFAIGSAGAGYGATTATLRGGLGSASADCGDGILVGALVAANPLGSATIGEGPHFWAAPLEEDKEFGGRGWPHAFSAADRAVRLKGSAPANTTIAVVATNARLSKAGCHRLAVMAQAGLARAITPIHTPLDGDTVFAVSTGRAAELEHPHALARVGAKAADCLARAVARAIHAAAPVPAGWIGPPAYRTRFLEDPA